jgi:ribosomal protein L37AE/L43A
MMQKRTCPYCFTRWHGSDSSSSSSRVWECEVCGHDIPVLKDENLIEIKIPNKRRLLESERTESSSRKTN